jgi:Protein kinase domain
MNEPSLDRDPFEGVAESFLSRFRAGAQPSVAEYAARHPELADQIRRLLPALVMVEQDLSVDVDAAPAARDAIESQSKRLGDYRILREIGRGGMGVVYEAEQVSLGRRVALKVLPGHVAGDGKALERFRREAKSAARLHHTNIVPVFEVGQDGATAYYAMQFIQGQGLDQIIDELVRLRDQGRYGQVITAGQPTATAAPDAGGATLVGRVAELVVSGRFVAEGAVPLSAVTEPVARGPTSHDAPAGAGTDERLFRKGERGALAKGRQGADAPRSPLGTACPGERGASAPCPVVSDGSSGPGERGASAPCPVVSDGFSGLGERGASAPCPVVSDGSRRQGG